MKRDFTLKVYEQLLKELQRAGYVFLTYKHYCLLQGEGELPERFVVLRHDVDKRPLRSLAMARVEAALGVRATYYFRCLSNSEQPSVIRNIAALGHEVGYHYEDVALCRGNIAEAKAHFAECLEYFRTFYPVATICMHGSPMSKYDNRELWQHCSYRNFGIVGEPYFDTDFTQVGYLTDTGRCWDGEQYSVRDRVESLQACNFHTTIEVIEAIAQGGFPCQMLITTHPQRWCDHWAAWLLELLTQTAKNQVKRALFRR